MIHLYDGLLIDGQSALNDLNQKTTGMLKAEENPKNR